MSFKEKLDNQLRKLSQRLPDFGTKVIVHLHRPFVGKSYTPIKFGRFHILVSPQDYCGGRLYYWGS